MALSPENEALFNHLASKKEARAKLIKIAEETGFTEHSAIRGRQEVEAIIAPFKEEIEDLKKAAHAREQADTWGRQRNSVRGGRFRFDDEKIAKLEERMKDPDAPHFPQTNSKGETAYQQAAEYFAQLDSPISPSTVPMLDMGGFPVTGNQDTEPWRKDLLSDDPNINPLKMPKKKRRLKAREAWKRASSEYMEKLAANTGTQTRF